MSKQVKEALLEGARVVALAVVSYLLTEGVLDLVLSQVFNLKLDVAQKMLLTGFVTTSLKSVDKWLHELGKAKKSDVMKKGLTRF